MLNGSNRKIVQRIMANTKMNTKMNEDIRREREKATFDAGKLTEFIYGGKEKVERRRYLQSLVFNDKYLQSFKPFWNRSREEAYDTCVKKSVHLLRLCKRMGVTDKEEKRVMFSAAVPNEEFLFGVHNNMFIPTIEQQATKEQQDKYLDRARRFEIIGTYAQTELGHGTFIRGIETTATYDPASQEFIINSPTITAMKYWPGILGKTANHAVVMAQLYTRGTCHGMHAFLVQLRSMDDHKLLPGVKTGDIGNKMGFTALDNGFLMFDSYRVPREAMLMKNAKVEPDGTYVPPKNTKLTYGVMVFIRCILVRGCGLSLGQACTIATRYSAVRHQTEIRPGGPEPQIIDYQTQQQKLFPLIAASYALLFSGANLEETYIRVQRDIAGGQLAEVQVLHAVSSGLKALAGYTASHGVDRLRMSCGGHGYTHASGLPKIFSNITPACTYEGENTVMYLQCGRFLIKCYAQARAGKELPAMVRYLSQEPKSKSSITQACELPSLKDAFEHTSARLIQDAATRMQTLVRGGAAPENARNSVGVYLVKAAEIHSLGFVVRGFAEQLNKTRLEPSLLQVLNALCSLYAISSIKEHLGEFMQDGYLSGQQSSWLTDRMLALFEEIRPNAVALVDAFDFHDEILQSCLGRYDGNVYEALYKYAQDSPLNKEEVLDSYFSTLRPLMKGGLGDPTQQSRL